MVKLRKFVSAPEAAKRLSVSVTTFKRLLAERQVPFFKIGSCYRIDLEDIEEYLRHMRTSAKYETSETNDS